MEKTFDVAVLGGGPGGYVAAIRTAQLGKKTVLIEKDNVGGTCLNRGCIPTKALLYSAEVYHTVKTAADFGVDAAGVSFDYKRIASRKSAIVKKLTGGVGFLVKNAGAELITGEGKLTDAHTITVNGDTIKAENIIIATGSAPAKLPIPGIDTEGVLNSDGVLALETCPESLVIIGGGVIGIEFATLFNTLGKKVCVVEMMENILPGIDEEIASSMERLLKKKGIEIVTGAKVLGLRRENGVACEYEKNGEKKTAYAEACVVAVGRKPVTADIGLESAGVKTERGFIQVDETMKTSVPNIYAIGDLTGKVQLAHVASAQGLVAAANIAGEKKKMRYDIVPSCIYTHPEIASVGITEKQAREKGLDVKLGKFPVSANGKSMVMGDSDGFVKIVTEAKTGEILGAHMMAPRATDMITEFSVLMKAEGTIDELIDTIHPHPTVSEMIMEAAHDTEGLCIHAVSKK
jgi:dihydrolipoamide dehydrogenase